MPLNINQQPRGKDIWDKISIGADIASKVLGAYEDYQKVGVAKDEAAAKLASSAGTKELRDLEIKLKNAEIVQKERDNKILGDPPSPEKLSFLARAGATDLPPGITEGELKTGIIGDAAKAQIEGRAKSLADTRAQNNKIEAERRAEERKPPSEAQSTAATYARRAQEAEDVITKLHQSGFSPAGLGASVQSSNLYPEFAKSDDVKSYQQAKQNFVSAILRPESGAAISDKEYDREDKKYFPQPNDSEKVIAQKAESRNIAIKGLEAKAGKALDRVPTGVMAAEGMPGVYKNGSKSNLIPSAVGSRKSAPPTTFLNQKTGKTIRMAPNGQLIEE